MRTRLSHGGLSIFIIAAATAFLLLAPWARAERQVLPNHLPAAVRSLQPVGRLPQNHRLHLSIGLPLRNREALTNLVEALYDPASPLYRQYLTPEQFTERFGPSEQDYTAVAAFLQANGFAISTRHSNRVLLGVDATVAEIERVMHLKLHTYQHPTEARSFYAPDALPALDLTVPLLSIGGLSDYARPRPAMLKYQPTDNGAGPRPQVGSATNGGFMGADFRAAYVPGVVLTGAGQTVGLLQFDGFYVSDILAYESLAGLPNVPLESVLLDGYDGTPGINTDEVALDIEMAISMAPELSKVIVYTAGPSGTGNDILNRMVTENRAKQLSSSWTFDTDAATPQIFMQMAAQGQSFFNASGDTNAYVGGLVDAPADSPYITIVGGTTLRTSGPAGAWVSETVWRWSGRNGSGGGITGTYGLPVWQQGINMTACQGSTNQRNIPDVALVADNVFVISGGSAQAHLLGGTSCAAPLWAGFTALANQQAAASGQPPVGFLNPGLYAIGMGTNYAACFHDITTGNNTSSASPTQFYAVVGYDLCTGWGTPMGSNLINALVTPSFLPVVAGAGSLLLNESFPPANGTIDPGETVTVSFALQNIGLANTTNLVATLLATNGVLSPGVPQSYGSLFARGPAVTRPFTFVANGACGSTITAVLQLQDGGLQLSNVSFDLPVGRFVAPVTFTQNFDAVTAPALPSGWTAAASGGASNWVASATVSDTAPNSMFVAESAQPGVGELISPAIPIVAPSAQLTFKSRYDFETSPGDLTVGYDGGLLEIQIGTGPFADILSAGGSFVSGGYTGTIADTDTDNPLHGRACWTGSTKGFVETRVNLPAAAAGQNVRFKWRFGTDVANGYGGTGWYIDTVAVLDGGHYICGVPLLTPAMTSGNFTFSFPTVGGQNYTVQYTDNLTNSSWTTLSSLPGNGSPQYMTNAAATPQRFYRVQILSGKLF